MEQLGPGENHFDLLRFLHLRNTEQRLARVLKQAKIACRRIGDMPSYEEVYNALAQHDMLPREACTDLREMSYEEIQGLPPEQRAIVLQCIRETFEYLRTS